MEQYVKFDCSTPGNVTVTVTEDFDAQEHCAFYSLCFWKYSKLLFNGEPSRVPQAWISEFKSHVRFTIAKEANQDYEPTEADCADGPFRERIRNIRRLALSPHSRNLELCYVEQKGVLVFGTKPDDATHYRHTQLTLSDVGAEAAAREMAEVYGYSAVVAVGIPRLSQISQSIRCAEASKIKPITFSLYGV